MTTPLDHPDDDGEAAKTAVYLVLLEHAVGEPAYSVFRVDAASRRANHLLQIPAFQYSMYLASDKASRRC
jgi:hypothetical protein